MLSESSSKNKVQDIQFHLMDCAPLFGSFVEGALLLVLPCKSN